jgi:hypothetical protein
MVKVPVKERRRTPLSLAVLEGRPHQTDYPAALAYARPRPRPLRTCRQDQARSLLPFAPHLSHQALHSRVSYQLSPFALYTGPSLFRSPPFFRADN